MYTHPHIGLYHARTHTHHSHVYLFTHKHLHCPHTCAPYIHFSEAYRHTIHTHSNQSQIYSYSYTSKPDLSRPFSCHLYLSHKHTNINTQAKGALNTHLMSEEHWEDGWLPLSPRPKHVVVDQTLVLSRQPGGEDHKHRPSLPSYTSIYLPMSLPALKLH